MLRITTLLVVAALAATAQTPIPRPFGECGTADAVDGTGAQKARNPELRGFSGLFGFSGDLCEKYTYEAGWKETMQLQLGEGSEDYLPLIEQAVKVWNETVYLPKRTPLIEISDERPENYELSRSFWKNKESASRRNLDSENVIYFTAAGDEDAPRGTARTKTSRFDNRIVESDIYINTADEEEYGPNLVLTKLITDHEGLFAEEGAYGEDYGWGAYAMVNATYVVILHELGHAVGLQHIPVRGNVMSRDFMPGVDGQWKAALAALWEFRQLNRRGGNPWDYLKPPFNKQHSHMYRYMTFFESQRDHVDSFTKAAKLGEQEKMALACIYEY